MAKITLTWHGHSCFSIANDRYSIVIDPYKADMIGYPPLHVRAHAMLASHKHDDHNYRAAVKFLDTPGSILLELEPDQDWPTDPDPYIFYYKKLLTNHDDAGGAKRGSNIIHIINSAGVKIAHFGDLGHKLTHNQQSALQGLDLILIPVGGYYTIDAAQAYEMVQQLEPRNIVPMHFIWDYGNLPIATVEPFINLVRNTFRIDAVKGSQLSFEANNSGRCYLFTKIKSQA